MNFEYKQLSEQIATLEKKIESLADYLIVQRDFMVLRDFGWYYETLRFQRFEFGLCKREGVCLR